MTIQEAINRAAELLMFDRGERVPWRVRLAFTLLWHHSTSKPEAPHD